MNPWEVMAWALAAFVVIALFCIALMVVATVIGSFRQSKQRHISNTHPVFGVRNDHGTD